MKREMNTTIIPEILKREVSDLLRFLSEPERNEPNQYEVIKTRLDCMRFITEIVEKEINDTKELRTLQKWFRENTESCLSLSNTCRRARTWPEGFPGDFRTLEGIYLNEPIGDGLAAHLDRYSISSTLAVAIRSRLRKLSNKLQEYVLSESTSANWLNLACGPCRELLSISFPQSKNITVHCVDSDPNALEYAKKLTSGINVQVKFINENVFGFINAENNIKRFGSISTIYSAGLFDYISSDKLIKLINALYNSLQSGGVLLAPFKEKRYYKTFDYHWYSKWHYFLQRSEDDFRDIFKKAGIPNSSISMERDESGVILFYTIRKN